MSDFLTTGLTIAQDVPHGAGRIITVSTINVGYYVQAYLAGELIDSQDGAAGVVTFVVTGSSTDPLLFISVLEANKNTNYWDDAWSLTSVNGDKIRVRLPQDGVTYQNGDVWRVYLGADGAGSATTQVHKAPMFPGGRYVLGYGLGTYGTDAYGFDGANAAGYGAMYGLPPYGYDANFLEWISPTKPPGTYPVKVTVEDSLGNTSTAFETTQALATLARPATNLTVVSYVKGTDTLTLNFTATPDHP